MANDTSLATFLRELQQRTRHIPRSTPLPPTSLAELREITGKDGLIERFAAQVKSAGGNAHVVTAETWLATVREILRTRDAKSVVIETQPDSALTPERAAAIRAALSQDGITTTADRDDNTLFAIDASITGTLAAIAETGTIACISGPATARGATLIPPHHIALVAESQIVPDLFDFFVQFQSTIPASANVNLITGPSKTADIEGILVTGVHGPGRIDVVILRA